MRVHYTESFPKDAIDADGTLRAIRQLVDDRLAAEILKRLPKAPKSDQP